MYRLYVDEVGTDALTNLQEDNHRFLSLTGVAMAVTDARDNLEPKLNMIKAELFNHDPDAPSSSTVKILWVGKVHSSQYGQTRNSGLPSTSGY